MSQPRALISGITGQDGSYLAEHLLDLGYDVHGIVRTTTSDIEQTRIGHMLLGERPQVTLHVADLGDSFSLLRLVEEIHPHEIYNLAAQSHVRASFDMPVTTGDITALGALRLLECIHKIDDSIRFYQASSSEMFGAAPPPQNESTPFHPRSPYGVAKVYAYWAAVNYREAYAIHASNGILFNHESPRRGKEFVTRKITSHLPRILTGELKELRLGNLDARRDWGHARDYVRAMHLMVTHDEPLDLVVGTGESHTIREFLELAFGMVDLNWQDHVVIDEALYRPAEVDDLRSDPSLARATIGWEPGVTFAELVADMVRHDCAAHGIDV
ncbi:MAG TPA: GDP-mannose 4,6-dehydratase [Nitriliruptorales bacterium]|nr:GDP-mannose 4,6-dehydratase [Nitriliruptorales bacterium]